MTLISMFYITVGTLFVKRDLYWDVISRSWEGAQSYCRQNYTDLATFTNQAQSDQLRYGWTGLHFSQSQWRWSRGDVKANFTPWQIGQPRDNERCAYWSPNALYSADCSDSRNGVNCNDDRLVLVKENKTWEEALEFCRELKVDGSAQSYRLAQLISLDEIQTARDMLRAAQDQSDWHVWVGLRFLGDEWMWVGGGQTREWDVPGCPPVKRCGVLSTGTGLVTAAECHVKQYFFCTRI
ncbi:hypothetical protein WMY93_004907 [Mugilogobius chulae]|uniref:C-type lectin domain-containing protein n=1 Tax=Mugilogobius chulae TaxID=88201 RepID=A0AAW0PZN1_9GOBI